MLRKETGTVLLRSGPRDPESEADAPLSDPVGGRGTGSRAGGGCTGGPWPVRRRGLRHRGPRDVGRARPPWAAVPKPQCESSCPSACSYRVTTHGAAPPRLPKPHLRGQGLLCPDSRVFLLLSTLPDLLTVRAAAKAQGLCP